MSTRAFLRAALRLLRPHRGVLALTLAATLAAGLAFGALDPLFQKLLIDSLSRGRMHAFVAAAVLLAASGTAARALGYVTTVLAQRLKSRVAKELAVEMVGAFYRVPYAEVARHDRGYFVARVLDEPVRLAGDLVDVALTLARWLIVLAGAVAVALWLSWEVTLALCVVVPFLVRRARRTSGRIAELSRDESEREAVLKEGLGRAVDGYKTVALFGLRGPVTARVGGMLDDYLSTAYERVRQAAGHQASSGLLLGYAELLVTLAAAVQVVRGELTVGGLFGFVGAYFRVLSAVNTLVATVPSIGKLRGGVARLEEFARMGAGAGAPSPHDRVELAGVEVGFGAEPVLRGVDLRLERGERVLMTGPNGSGKSTLAHVVAGFLDGSGGEQRRPGRARVSALLLPFGFVPGTVRDNVDLDGLSEPKRREFLALAREFGLDGRLDQDPATLSQGEQRKLQVAMTLLKDADFYLFDEPLSNVDAPSKDRVMDTILARTRGRGLLVIMHGDERFRERFDREVDVLRFAPRTKPWSASGVVAEPGNHPAGAA